MEPVHAGDVREQIAKSEPPICDLVGQKGIFSFSTFLNLRAHNFLCRWPMLVHFAYRLPAA